MLSHTYILLDLNIFSIRNRNRNLNIFSIIFFLRLNEIGIHSKVHSWFICFVSSIISSVKINSSLSSPYVNIHKVLLLALYFSLFIFFLYN